jgi:hypothetical protein
MCGRGRSSVKRIPREQMKLAFPQIIISDEGKEATHQDNG